MKSIGSLPHWKGWRTRSSVPGDAEGGTLRTIETEITIDATPERVWSVLSDFGAYPDWNPFIRRIDGEAAVGERIEVNLQLADSKPKTFRPRVEAFDPPRELRWLGSLGFPGIFDGAHQFRIEPTGGGTRFVHREEFRGVLAGLILRFIGAKTSSGFEAMNTALKQRAESA